MSNPTNPNIPDTRRSKGFTYTRNEKTACKKLQKAKSSTKNLTNTKFDQEIKNQTELIESLREQNKPIRIYTYNKLLNLYRKANRHEEAEALAS